MEFIPCDSSNYRQGRTDGIKYIVIHYTSNDGDTAKGNCKYFQGENRGASAHYFVDENEVCQSVKENDTAWHCGAKVYKHKDCRNTNSIGIELCSRYHGDLKKDKAEGKVDFSKYYILIETQTKAVSLINELMKKYSIPAEKVLRHYDVTGKTCPAPFVAYETLWANFKRQLEKQKMPVEEAEQIFREKVKLSHPEPALEHIKSYEYGNELLIKLAEAMR